MNDDQLYSIGIEHRPCRIAFFLDPDATDHRVLDEIVNFNIDHWGGRHNPIIPTKGGAIYPEYKSLLEVADPDIFYCYSDLNEQSVIDNDWSIGPILMEGPRRFMTRQDAVPPLHIEHQVSISPLLVGLKEEFPPWMRKPEPSILAFNYDKGENHKASRFVRTNFGVSPSAYFCHRDFGVNATFVPSADSNEAVLSTITDTMNLVRPIEVAGNAPIRKILGRIPYEREFLICYGDSPWNVIHYWNHAFFYAPQGIWAGGINQIWLPQAVVGHEAIYKELIRLILRKVYVQEGSRGLRIISYDHDTAELDDLAKRICSDSKGHLRRLPTSRIEPGKFEAGNPEPPLTLKATPRLVRYVAGRDIHLDTGKPAGIEPGTNEGWMVDVEIENPFQEKWYINQRPSWTLPKRRWIARTFAGSPGSRIASEGRLSLPVRSGAEGQRLTIPRPIDLFRSLLSPESLPSTPSDPRTNLRYPKPGEAIKVSDKGKCLRGFLSLFPTLRGAVYFFEHPFWRSIFEELCCNDTSGQAHDKVSHDIRDHLPAVRRQVQESPDELIEWLTNLTLKAARKMPSDGDPLTLAQIDQKFHKFLEGITDESRKNYVATLDLREALSELTGARVLFQGAEVRCQRCLSNFWYHVDDLKTLITCKGCRNEIPLPAESTWSYEANALLRAAMRYQGVVPVIRCIGRLAEHARSCFVWSAGLEYFDYEQDRIKSKAEVDLCWVKDGEFSIAEVKTSSNAFGAADIDRLVDIASMVRPESVLVAAVDGEDGPIEKTHAKISDRLGKHRIKTEILKPSDFKKTPHWIL